MFAVVASCSDGPSMIRPQESLYYVYFAFKLQINEASTLDTLLQ